MGYGAKESWWFGASVYTYQYFMVSTGHKIHGEDLSRFRVKTLSATRLVYFMARE